jgi:hypothetical protein
MLSGQVSPSESSCYLWWRVSLWCYVDHAEVDQEVWEGLNGLLVTCCEDLN